MSLISRFCKTALAQGAHPAIVNGDSTTSYAELSMQAEAIAALLGRHEVGPRTTIGLVFEPSADYIASMLGVLWSGNVLMPLNPSFPPDRIAEVARRTNCQGIMFAEQFRNLVASATTGTAQCLASHPALGARGSLYFCPINRHSAHESSEQSPDACYVIATSGSTGRPKLILGSERGLEHFIDWEVETFQFDQRTRCSFLSNISFDVSLRDILPALVQGGTVCVPEESVKLTPGRLLQWLEQHDVTHMHIVPTLLRALFAATPEAIEPTRLASLRYALIAGEPLFGRDVSQWRGRINRSTALVNLYGPSETTLAKFSYTITNVPEAHDSIPVGRPIPGAEVFLLPPSSETHTEPMSGEVVIATSFMSRGYIDDELEQRNRFIANPGFPTEVKLVYLTGDMGRILDSGDLVLTGRKDNQVKFNGNRLELPEIEAALLLHPEVSQAAVAVKIDRLGNQRLVGYIVPTGPQAPTFQSLREVARKRLPDYMIPTTFVHLQSMPLTHSNKIDRGALPQPSRQRPNLRDATPPTNPTEIALVEIWKLILDLDDVGVEDGFFELGGTSLLALQAIELIKQKLFVDAPVTSIFQYPTIRQLAGYISGAPATNDVSAAAARRAASRRASIRRRPN